jgi:hypothetical protein
MASLRHPRRGVILGQLMKLGAFGAIGVAGMTHMDEIGDALEAPYDMGLAMATTIELRQIYNGLVGRVAAGGILVDPEQFQPWVREEFTRPDGTDPAQDPWKNDYGYVKSVNITSFRLASRGRDGVWSQNYTGAQVDEAATGDDIYFRWAAPGGG